MKRIMKYLACVSLTVSATASYASQVQDVYITDITMLQNGVALFNTSATAPGLPSCAPTGRWTIDGSTPAGQARLSALLSAFLAGRRVSVMGTGDCSVWWDSENVDYLVVGAN